MSPYQKLFFLAAAIVLIVNAESAFADDPAVPCRANVDCVVGLGFGLCPPNGTYQVCVGGLCTCPTYKASLQVKKACETKEDCATACNKGCQYNCLVDPTRGFKGLCVCAC